ncbi:hypothetical protein VUR80DRAFT_6256 [Thermomyces stellatus]
MTTAGGACEQRPCSPRVFRLLRPTPNARHNNRPRPHKTAPSGRRPTIPSSRPHASPTPPSRTAATAGSSCRPASSPPGGPWALTYSWGVVQNTLVLQGSFQSRHALLRRRAEHWARRHHDRRQLVAHPQPRAAVRGVGFMGVQGGAEQLSR